MRIEDVQVGTRVVLINTLWPDVYGLAGTIRRVDSPYTFFIRWDQEDVNETGRGTHSWGDHTIFEVEGSEAAVLALRQSEEQRKQQQEKRERAADQRRRHAHAMKYL